jgi:pimeloyl-ACP methyl ester carboxylesterase
MIEQQLLSLPHGIQLACRTAGGGRPQVLLLHGFPEAAFIWDEVMAMLAQGSEPVACIAPNLRGFAGSSAPEGVAAYRAKDLVGDVAALITATQGEGRPIDLLVAHDWGGALAWNLAALQPQLLRRLLIINSPHPGAFLRELRHNPAQQKASAYMNFLCRPDAARLLAERDFARLWPFFGGAAWLTPELRDRYRATWGEGGAGLDAQLNYYRASPLRPPLSADDPLHQLQLPEAMLHVHVPTTVLWGEQDQALLPSLLDGLADWIPALKLQRVPEASHWLVHEQPGRVAATIRAELAAAAA